MGMKSSTGLIKGMLDSNSFNALMAGMKLKVYSGVEPVSADAGLGAAVLLVTYTLDDTGAAISWEAEAVGNVIQKNSAEVWKGTTVASGTASFCRFELGSDTGAASTNEIRLQGDVGVAGKFLNMSSVALTAGAVQTLESFAIAFPLQ